MITQFKDLAPNLNTMGLASKPATNAPGFMQKPMQGGMAKGPAAAALAAQPKPSGSALPQTYSASNPFAD